MLYHSTPGNQPPWGVCCQQNKEWPFSRATFARRGSWNNKIAPMFKRVAQRYGPDINGLFVRVRPSGRSVVRQKVSISSGDKFNALVHQASHGHVMHMWASCGKSVRLKVASVYRSHDVEAKKPKKAKVKVKSSKKPKPRVKMEKQKASKGDENEDNPSERTPSSSVDSICSSEENSESEEEQEEEGDWLKPCGLNKSARDYFQDKWVYKKRSKPWHLNLEMLGADFPCEGTTQSYVKSNDLNAPFPSKKKLKLERRMLKEYKPRSKLSLADFFDVSVAVALGVPLSKKGKPYNDPGRKQEKVDNTPTCTERTEPLSTQSIRSQQLSNEVPDVLVADIFAAEAEEDAAKQAPCMEEEHKDDVLTTTTGDSLLTVPPNFLLVKLLSASVSPDSLSSEFRQDYREAECEPRRFVLNISRLVQHHAALLRRLQRKRASKPDLTTYLVFAFCTPSDKYVDEYKVWMSSLWSNATAAEIFGDLDLSKVIPLQDLINNAVQAVDYANDVNHCQVEERTEQHTAPSIMRPVCDFLTLTSVTKWKYDIVSVPKNSEWQKNNIRASGNGNGVIDLVLKETKTEAPLMRGPSVPSLCGLCLKDFSNVADGGRGLPLALNTCKHWFCELCWKTMLHLELKKQNLSHVVCIEESCPAHVDPVTLITLLDIDQIRQVEKNRMVRNVQGMKHVKICPNAACEKIIFGNPRRKSYDKTLMVVTCDCSTQLCFSCLQPPHWPSSCDIAHNYRRRLEQRQEDLLTRALDDKEFPEVILRGKKCPSCDVFVQRHGSQRTESCGCGAHFCWACGRQVIEGDHSRCSERFEADDKLLKENLLNKGTKLFSDDKTSKWYKVALLHRRMRNPEVLNVLYDMALNLATKMGDVEARGKYVGDTKKASTGWRQELKTWTEENMRLLERIKQNNIPAESVLSHLEPSTDEFDSNSKSSRPASRALSSAMSILSDAENWNPATAGGSDIVRAAFSIVHIKTELHHLVEHAAAFMDGSLGMSGLMARSLERAEDLCTSLGILLQDPHVHNAARIIPTFLRLQTQAKQTIGNMAKLLEEER